MGLYLRDLAPRQPYCPFVRQSPSINSHPIIAIHNIFMQNFVIQLCLLKEKMIHVTFALATFEVFRLLVFLRYMKVFTCYENLRVIRLLVLIQVVQKNPN